jgi:hypothetical protein
MSDVSLKEYIDVQITGVHTSIDNLKSLMAKQFELNERAVKLAQEALTIRLEHMNEFRAQILEERANLATKENLIAVYDKLDERIKPLETAKSVSSGQLKLLATLPAGVAMILALIALFAG